MDERNATALVGGKAYIGPDLTPMDDAVVVVREGRIAAVGARSEVPIPPDARIVSTTGTTMLPGFIDAHVHIAFADPSEVLRRGVTCVRDLAWPPDVIYPLAERSLRWGADGPLILTVGPMLTVEGGYPITAGWARPGTGLAVGSPAHAREVVARLAGEGVAAIKVALNPPAGAVLTDEQLRAIVDEAHAHDRVVTAHVYGLDQLHRALDAGVDEMAHMLTSPEEIPASTVRRMVELGTVVVPTLSIFSGRPARIATGNLARLLDAGGRVVYGTDLGNAGPRPGIDPTELKRMSEAGMTVAEIVRAATVDAASWLGLDHKGSLSPGHDADVIAVPAAERVEDLTDVVMVMRGGVVAD